MMGEAAKPMAVEDVLTSIRRLLAQDSGATGEISDPGELSIENTLAALEAAMAGRRTADVAAPAGEIPAPEAEPVGSGPLTDDVRMEQPEPAAEAADPEPAEEPVADPEEAPFIAVDMTEPAPSFSFRHSAEIRRLQLVNPRAADPDPGELPETELLAQESPAPETEDAEAAEAVAETESAMPPEAPEEVTFAAAATEPEPVPEPAERPVALVEPVVAEPVAVEPPPVSVTESRRPPARRPEPSEAPQSIFDDSDELPIDLEVLRRVVGDILRQELQGALGERMTRNVRKLVRAEIRRALLERDEG